METLTTRAPGVGTTTAGGRSRPLVRVRSWPTLGATGLLGADGAGPAGRADTPQPTYEDLLDLCTRHDLRGRGGAGFPLATKLRAVRDEALEQGRPPQVVVNGEEGEPASVKDRVLMTRRPDLVLDGALLVARALDATVTHVYAGEEDCRSAIAERLRSRPGGDRVAVFPAQRGYVSGEESAVVRALSGGPAKPTAKPPRPFQAGVDGAPTLVSNVETLAQLARLARGEHDGTGLDATVLLTVSSDRGAPFLVEVPSDRTLREVLAWLSLWPHTGLPTVILGGFFGGIAGETAFDLPLDHDALRSSGHSLGCGIVIVLEQTCPVSAVAEILGYLDLENAQQCGPCFRGIPSMLAAVEAVADGTAAAEELDRLQRWTETLRGRGACGTLDAACGAVAGLLEHRRAALQRHLAAPCHTCAGRPPRTPSTQFAISWPTQLEEIR
jgi:NADH:ubiquinone oxidoreductase subunit F (NADH-binding)